MVLATQRAAGRAAASGRALLLWHRPLCSRRRRPRRASMRRSSKALRSLPRPSWWRRPFRPMRPIPGMRVTSHEREQDDERRRQRRADPSTRSLAGNRRLADRVGRQWLVLCGAGIGDHRLRAGGLCGGVGVRFLGAYGGDARDDGLPAQGREPTVLRHGRRFEAEHERAAGRPAVLGPLGQGAGDHPMLLLGQARQVGRLVEMLVEDLVDRVAHERPPARAELGVGHGQRILVAPPRDPAFEHLGRHVVRRHAPRMAGAAGLQDLRQPEVGEPGRAADEEDVVRLDVAVLDPDQAAVAGRVAGLVEEVDGPGQLVHVAEQLVARQAGQALRLARVQAGPSGSRRTGAWRSPGSPPRGRRTGRRAGGDGGCCG